MTISLIRGDCTVELWTLPADSFDSCVCDPPYHLTSVVERFGSPTAAPAQFGQDGAYSRASVGFMGKVWDGGDVAFRPETWAAVYRVLKPGAFLLAMAGTRTYHRMTCAIEDAGFEVRDAILWLYGSGFPKSHDVSKAIDKAAGVMRKVVGATGHCVGPSQKAGYRDTSTFRESEDNPGNLLTAPGTLEAIQWKGWGTALKPAVEMIAMARKPLSESTVARNMRWHGTGALNIDASRVELNGDYKSKPNGRPSLTGLSDNYDSVLANTADIVGRWPANVIHDGSDEVLEAFAVSGTRTSGKASFEGHSRKQSLNAEMNVYEGGLRVNADAGRLYGDAGSAARFYYAAKANKGDRAGSRHPTVKPVALIRHLVRLVTQPGGSVLDPFAGSGTTAAAAQAEGMDATLIEREAEYEDDIRLRLGWGSLTGVMRRNEYARKRLEAALRD